VDGVVNRVGAHFLYTHHIRVEQNRCSGCKICAEKCMCGAIKMVNQVAVVDQFSCMSCQECVDVCDWNAIELTTGSRNKNPKRVRKNIDIHPEPDWQSILKVSPKVRGKKKKPIKESNSSKIISFALVVTTLSSLMFFIR